MHQAFRCEDGLAQQHLLFGSLSAVIGSKDCRNNTYTAGGALTIIYLLARLSIPAQRRIDFILQQTYFLRRILGQATALPQFE